jgi:hypothetical protein
MGWWFWNSSPSSSSPDSVDQLPSDLRKYLDRETPKPQHSSPEPEPRSYAEQLHLRKPSNPSPEPSEPSKEPDKPHVPRESLYPDGRYAHLWKNYRPQHQIDSAVQTDAEKLRDMFESYEDRKREIGRTALENCVFQQLAYSDCLKGGSAYARSTLCWDENKALTRCIEMQGKFLKALGYLSVPGRDPQVEERIQMHADKLYQRMLEQERLREEAREKGEPLPEFPPILNPQTVSRFLDMQTKPSVSSSTSTRTPPKELYRPNRDDPIDLSDIPSEKARDYFRKTLRENPEWSRERMEVERAELIARYREDLKMAKAYDGILDSQKKAAEERWAAGRPTVGDRMLALRKYLY